MTNLSIQLLTYGFEREPAAEEECAGGSPTALCGDLPGSHNE